MAVHGNGGEDDVEKEAVARFVSCHAPHVVLGVQRRSLSVNLPARLARVGEVLETVKKRGGKTGGDGARKACEVVKLKDKTYAADTKPALICRPN